MSLHKCHFHCKMLLYSLKVPFVCKRVIGKLANKHKVTAKIQLMLILFLIYLVIE